MTIYRIRAKMLLVQFVVSSVSVIGIPHFTMYYTLNDDLATTFATEEECQRWVDNFEPNERALWRVEKFNQ
ncbi:TMhelix containing protein [Vibrio phage 1.081.O._10N.286.52.C2]|nr:TMhelix containing protein [Vibrio phage 1.081.O._10N.286.52.C2]